MNTRSALAQYLGELAYSKFLAAEKNFAVVSPIIALGFVICPAAVRSRISLGTIDAIKTHSFGTFAHVLKEGFKVSPFWSDRDATSTIETVKGAFRIVATLKKSLPNFVDQIVASAVSSDLSAFKFSTQTTATLGGATL